MPRKSRSTYEKLTTPDELILWNWKHALEQDIPDLFFSDSRFMNVSILVFDALRKRNEADTTELWIEAYEVTEATIKQVNANKYHPSQISFKERQALRWCLKHGHWPWKETPSGMRELTQFIKDYQRREKLTQLIKDDQRREKENGETPNLATI